MSQSIFTAVLTITCLCMAQGALPGKPVNIAFMVLTTNAAYSPMFSNFTHWPANYTETKGGLLLQPYWTTGTQFYRDYVNSHAAAAQSETGSGFVINANEDGLDYTIPFVIDYFPVALTTDSVPTRLAKMQLFMTDALDGLYNASNGAPYTVFVSPPIDPLANAASEMTLANLCESYPTQCIYVLPITIDPTVYICTVTNVTGTWSLPDDCVSRGRKANARRFHNTISMAPPSLQIVNDWMQLLTQQGMSSLSILATTNWVPQMQAAIQNAEQLNVAVLYQRVFNPATDVQSVDWWVGIIQDVIASGSQGMVLFIGYTLNEGSICLNIMLAMQQLDYMPTALNYAASCQAVAPYVSTQWNSQNLQLYASGVVPWTPVAHGPDFSAQSAPYAYEPFALVQPSTPNSAALFSPAVFNNLFSNRFGTALNAEVPAQAALLPWFLQKALEITSNHYWTLGDLLLNLPFVSLPSHYGHGQLDVYGRFQDRPYPCSQFVPTISSNGLLVPNNAYLTNIIAPIGDADILYPMPNWSDRTYNFQYISSTAETLFATLLGIGELVAVLTLAAVVVHRESKAIKGATAAFCGIIVGGSMLLMAAGYQWTLYETDTTCMSKVWMIAYAFALIYVPLFLKTYRIYCIFETQQLLMVKLPLRALIVALITVLVLLTVYLSIWQATAPLVSAIVIVDPYRPLLNYTVCQTSGSATGFLLGLIVLYGGVMLSNAWMAFRTRKVPDTFKESANIAALVYLHIFVLIIILTLLGLWGGQSAYRTSSFVIHQVGLLVVGLLTLAVLFGPKFVRIYTNDDEGGDEYLVTKVSRGAGLGGTPGHTHVAAAGAGAGAPLSQIATGSGGTAPHISGGNTGTVPSVAAAAPFSRAAVRTNTVANNDSPEPSRTKRVGQGRSHIAVVAPSIPATAVGSAVPSIIDSAYPTSGNSYVIAVAPRPQTAQLNPSS